jgi:hypothetical protein
MIDGYVQEFIDDLRTRGAEFRRYGDEPRAKLCDVHAEELEARRATYLGEELTPGAAAQESGFSTKHLRRLEVAGVITLKRGDLPRRPGHGVQRQPRIANIGPNVADRVLTARARTASAHR